MRGGDGNNDFPAAAVSAFTRDNTTNLGNSILHYVEQRSVCIPIHQSAICSLDKTVMP